MTITGFAIILAIAVLFGRLAGYAVNDPRDGDDDGLSH